MVYVGKDIGGSQFFFVYELQFYLNGVYIVFGKVIEGFDIVLKMKNGDVMKEVKVWEE